MSLRFFGTDGIRGPYGGESLNDEIAFRAGRAAVRVAREQLFAPVPQIMAGRDTRASGPALFKAFAAGVRAEGGKVIDLGVAPTPCVAFATRVSEATLACSLTASHNPACDNGIKFFEGSGVKPSEALEQALDTMVGQVTAEGYISGAAVEVLDGGSFRELYADSIAAFFPGQLLKGMRVALDCSNGAMHEIAPAVFRRLGAELTIIGDSPDGLNINSGVGSEHPESLAALFNGTSFDFGFAFDGDGDRLLMLDGCGKVVPGEAVLAVLAIDAKTIGELPGDTLVTTIQSNLGLDAALKESGIKVERTNVGDKHIARLMISTGYLLGGEESGHVVVGKFAVTGDGLVAAIALAGVIARTGKSIAELASVYSAFPQLSKAVRVASKRPISECSKISSCIEKLEAELGDQGRLLVRYSGTEPKIRLLVEAGSESLVASAMDELLAAVESDLDVV